MADWNTPTLSSLYTDFLAYLKDRDVDIAKQFDGTTSSNVPTGAIKWNSTSNRWNKWDGSAWQELTTSYGFNSVTLPNGTANGVAYLNGSKVLTSGSALTFDGSTFGATADIKINAASNSTRSLYFGPAGGNYAKLTYDDSTGSLSVGTLYNYPLIFLQSGSEQMRLTSTGLGIGTSSPGYKLTVDNGYIGVRSGNGITFLNAANNSTSAINNTAASGSSNLYFQTPSGNMTLDSSGNLGLGVTPSSGTGWTSQIEMVSGANIVSQGTNISLGQNYYYNSGYKYKANGYAAQYLVYNGAHQFFTAPSGTAGNAISFTQAMTLDASGNLGIGTATPSCKLDVIQSSVGSSGATSNGIRVITTGTTNGLAIGQSNSARYLALGSYYMYCMGETLELGTSNVSPITFNTNGSERMRVNGDGNVGIGTSSPAGKLDVSGSVSGGNLAIRFRNTATTASSTTTIDLSEDGLGRSVWRYSPNTGDTMFGGVDAGSYNLRFYTAATERMRIDSSGNLLVGATGFPGGGNVGIGLCKPSTSQTAASRWAVDTTSSAYMMTFINNNGFVGSIQTSGSATSYVTSSDYRLKENIQPMQGALAVVQQLNPVTYTWKADGSDGQGFIAHELQAVVPDCVTGEKDAVDEEGNPVYQGIDTSFLVATLTKAIQELKAELDATKAEVAALEVQ